MYRFVICMVCITFLLTSCEEEYLTSENLTVQKEFQYYKIQNDSLRLTQQQSEIKEPNDIWVFTDYMNKGGGPFLLPSSFSKTDTITFQITLDSSLEGLRSKYNSDHINAILHELKAGYHIEFEIYEIKDLSNISTEGKLNQDNIFNALGWDTGTNDNDVAEYRIILFKNSEFFNTANAVCLKDDEDVYIVGDGNLLYSPMLFIHEFGHALGLNHNNLTSKCGNTYNVMHESNIGCALNLSKRQIMMAHSQSYVPPFRDQDDPPVHCNCKKEYLGSLVESYVNSIDRNIDDTPIIDNFTMLLTEDYRTELVSGTILNPAVEAELLSNFRQEWNLYIQPYFNKYININPVPSQWTVNSYVLDRMEVHKKLRKNNLARWLREADMNQNPSFDKNTNYFNNSVSFYEERLNELDQQICNSILNKMVSMYHTLEKYKIMYPRDSDVISCYLGKVEELERMEPINQEPNNSSESGRQEIPSYDLINFLKNALLE